nr:MAG TPA: hypothetical protein [Caudoviricetes sp.]
MVVFLVLLSYSLFFTCFQKIFLHSGSFPLSLIEISMRGHILFPAWKKRHRLPPSESFEIIF